MAKAPCSPCAYCSTSTKVVRWILLICWSSSVGFMIASFLIQAHSRRGGDFPARVEGDLLWDVGWTGFKGWAGRGKKAGEGVGGLVKEVCYAGGVSGGEQANDILSPGEA